MANLIAAVLAFFERHAAVFLSVFGTSYTVKKHEDAKKSQETLNEIKSWQAMERRAKSHGGIERMRQRSGKK